MNTIQDYVDIAQANVDKHLGDVLTGDESPEEIVVEVATLAYDALMDTDCVEEETIDHVVALVCKPYETE